MSCLYTLNDIKREFCFNSTRRTLFRKLKAELLNIEEQSLSLKVLLFGSFITSKDNPSDIDLLLCIIPKQEFVYDFMKNQPRRVYPDEIDLQYTRNDLLIPPGDKLVCTFNNNPVNRRNRVKIDTWIEIQL